jgi:chemotaxis protein MotB
MMAFFLLMWLINTTSPEQKRGIADYFAPASVSETTSGPAASWAARRSGKDGSKSSGSADVIESWRQPRAIPTTATPRTPQGPVDRSGRMAAAPRASRRSEEAPFASAAQSLRQALQDMPELAELSKNIIIDETPEGLRIQLVDQEGRSMFNQGQTQPNDRAKILLRADLQDHQPAAQPDHASTATPRQRRRRQAERDWQLSPAAPTASRQVLQGAGVDADRVYQVSGKATPSRSIPTTRRCRATAASPSCCCARRPCCRRPGL